MKQDKKETKEQGRGVKEEISLKIDEKIASLSSEEDNFEARLAQMQMERQKQRDELREKREQEKSGSGRRKNSARRKKGESSAGKKTPDEKKIPAPPQTEKPLEESQKIMESGEDSDIWREIRDAIQEQESPKDVSPPQEEVHELEDEELMSKLDALAKEMEEEQASLKNGSLQKVARHGRRLVSSARTLAKNLHGQYRMRKEAEDSIQCHGDDVNVTIFSKAPGLTFEKKTAILHTKYKANGRVKWRRWWRKTRLRERRLAGRVAARVERLDRQINVWSRRKLFRRLKHLWERFCEALDWAEERKVLLVELLAIALFCTAAITTCIGHFTAYEYAYNGKVLGITKNKEDVYKTIDAIGDKLGTALNARVEIDKEKDITFNRVRGLHLELDSKDEVLDNLTYMQDLKVIACAIYVDNEPVAILQSGKMARDILEEIRENFTSQNDADYESISFAETVELRNVNVNLGEIENQDEVLDYMLTGAVEKKIHLVEKGQTFSEIAKLYGLKQSELEAMNPGIVPEKLKIGQEIILNRDRPVLTVQTVETAAYTEAIPFETEYEESSSMYEGESSVKRNGVNGQQSVTARIIRNNGEEISREILTAEVISEPQSKIVVKGTKKAPVRQGTGTFIWPVRNYRISSGYGSRWGRTHNGLDLATSRGSKIYASDGGTVTFAGYKGSFGYLVIINHGGNLESYYAHCSKLLVKKGDKVYQGQNIALVGSTGRSTGPHCHFEIRYKGTPRNPLNYL